MGRKVALLTLGTALVALVMSLVLPGAGERPSRPVPPVETNPSPDAPVDPGVVAPEEPPDVSSADGTPEAGVNAVDPGVRRVPVEVAVIDGDTGVSLPDARPGWIAGKDDVRPLAPGGGLFRHPELTVAVRQKVALKFDVELPADYGLEGPDGFTVQGTVSVYADRVRVTIPAWREAIVMVRVTDHEGKPVAGAVVEKATLCGGPREFSADPTDADGWTRVRGIPALRGADVRIRAAGNGRSCHASARIEDSGSPVRIVAVLPVPVSGGLFGLRGGVGRNLVAIRGGGRILRNLPLGSVTVVVRHRDGRLAVDTKVTVVSDGKTFTGLTNGNGMVTLRGVPAWTATVRVEEPGFVMGAAATVEVEAGQTVCVEIEEAPERWIRGVVHDASGRPLPSASVTVKSKLGGGLVWLHRGLQHLNVLTKADGRFEFPNVPPGHAAVRADYATRWTRVNAAKSGDTTIRMGPK